ncbi:hypothetical protein SETIT_3G039900v2 [Setaria italica]|uniref:Uncharacterized protein n=1 Tax=Setaria italica TaxID=4555 RepID=A0A368QB94_SETIT|nr:hypothetical protein SETIT_3G039900v2 [Setaria italica]
MAAARAWTTPAEEEEEEEEEATAAEASSATAASKRRRLSSPQHPRGMPPTPAAAGEAAAGKEEVEAVTESVAAAGAFVPNSPICRPYMVEYDSNGEELSEPSLSPDPVLSEAYEKAEQKYSKKIAQLPKLPTLDDETYFDSNPIQESAADTILTASKFVLGLSAYIGTWDSCI